MLYSHKPNTNEALLIAAAESVWQDTKTTLNINLPVGQKLSEAIKQYTGTEIESVFITDSDIRHIKKRHSYEERQRGQTAVTPQDFACLPLVLNDFESLEFVAVDKLGNKKFLLEKTINDTIFVVTIQRGKRKLEIKTMWKKKKMSGASC